MNFEEVINIDVIDRMYKGLKQHNKNRYYKIDNYLCVQLSKNKYMKISNTRRSKNLLKKHIFHTGLYANTNIKENDGTYTIKPFHTLYKNYDCSVLECDHINRNKFDNTYSNLRICTKKENMQNKTKYISNSSGIIGVCFNAITKIWIASINTNDNTRISKSYSLSKFPNARTLCTEWRKLKKIEYGYLN
jgi:hypothetical protein